MSTCINLTIFTVTSQGWVDKSGKPCYNHQPYERRMDHVFFRRAAGRGAEHHAQRGYVFSIYENKYENEQRGRKRPVRPKLLVIRSLRH